MCTIWLPAFIPCYKFATLVSNAEEISCYMVDCLQRTALHISPAIDLHITESLFNMF